MFQQPKLRIGLVARVIILSLLGIGFFSNISSAQTDSFHFGRTRSLVGASTQQLGDYALEYTANQFQVITGTPQVVLVKFVTSEDLPGLGPNPVHFASIEKPPLVLVIVKGNFGLGSILAAVPASVRAQWRATYISYVFDMWSAEAASTIASSKGGVFRKVLNDPSLPVEDPPLAGSTPIDVSSEIRVSSPGTQSGQSQTTSALSQPVFLPLITPYLHYGDVVPSIPTPTSNNK